MHVFQYFLSFAWKLKFYQEQQILSTAITDSLFIFENVCQIFKSEQFQYGGFPVGSDGKESDSNARDIGDVGSIPGSGRSPGEGHGNPLQCSCLQNSMDRGTRWATVHGVTESDMTEQLTHTQLFLVKIMSPKSSQSAHLETQITALFSSHHCPPVYTSGAPSILLHRMSTRVLKNQDFQQQRLDKIHFYCFIKDILK